MIFTVEEHEEAYKIVVKDDPKANKTPIAIVPIKSNADRIALLLNSNESRNEALAEVTNELKKDATVRTFKYGYDVYRKRW
jgi:hypothetical protein